MDGFRTSPFLHSDPASFFPRVDPLTKLFLPIPFTDAGSSTMRSLATLVASLLLATPSLASSLSTHAEDAGSIFARSSDNAPSYDFDERTGILTEHAPSSLTSDLDKRDTFSATFGLMLERDLATDPNANRFQKRKHGDIAKRARDSGREVVEVAFSKRGELVLPASVLEKRAKEKKNQKKKKTTSKAKSHAKKQKSHKMNKVARSTNKKKSKSGNLQSSSTNGIQRSLIKLAASIPKISVSFPASNDTGTLF